jgi:hypothetical protein
MVIMRNQSLHVAVTSFLCTLGACANHDALPASGTCVVADSTEVNCDVAGLSAASIGLVGYSCTGTARPDDNPTYLQGVPQGLVCADKTAAATDGSNGYCCSRDAATCAYNPVALCDVGTYGYQCRGANRPEALNPAISCNQGVRQDDLINYCCSGTARVPACIQADSVGCDPGMTGWTCPGSVEPTAQDMGANKSRADLFYLLCPIPTPANNPKYNNYCCYTPALAPVGGTCSQDLKAPGCAAGRFGMSCYGSDTPDESFPELSCPAAGVPGASQNNYPATVYCCDFKQLSL